MNGRFLEITVVDWDRYHYVNLLNLYICIWLFPIRVYWVGFLSTIITFYFRNRVWLQSALNSIFSDSKATAQCLSLVDLQKKKKMFSVYM